MSTGLKAPVTPKEELYHEYHGRKFLDNYHWLKDMNSKKNPKILEYLNKENDYADKVLEVTSELRDEIYHEMVARIKETDMSVPYRRGEYEYYSRTEEGLQYSIQCRRRVGTDKEEVLLDLNQFDEKQIVLGKFSPSPDNKWLAYSLDTTGAEKFTIYFKNLESGEILSEPELSVPEAYYSIVWANDNKTVYYTVLDDILRSYEVRQHLVGQSYKEDKVVFSEPDQKFEVSISKSSSSNYIFIEASSSQTSEIHYLSADKVASKPTLFQERRFDVLYNVDHIAGDKFAVLTNQKEDQRYLNNLLCWCTLGSTSAENWRPLLAYSEDAFIEEIIPLAKGLSLLERSNGLTRIRVLDVETGSDVQVKDQHYLEFEQDVYTVHGDYRHSQYQDSILRFTYSTMITPERTFDYDLSSRKQNLLKETEVLGGFNSSEYVTKRIYVPVPSTASPGKNLHVPVSIVYKRSLFKGDGSNPCMLYGYGSYGLSMDPDFKSPIFSYVDRGFVYAIAHIRGGSEMGRQWYEVEGKFMHKKNTFHDFVACAEALIEQKYTSPDHLAIEGRSAGGMLMGGVINLRPDLFRAAIAGVPFVDVINTMMDASIPLTINEYEEWGNPEKEEVFDYMLSYSPYDNIARDTKTPNILIRAGLNDPRVSYWEPAKWAAKLREYGAEGPEGDADRRVILNKTSMGSGHFGLSGRYDYLKDKALEYAFVIHYAGRESGITQGISKLQV
ncbi:peptidase S9A prolyl oligopeptidase domain protein beta-propeller [Basidiobolus meristosporus CBS 931.73]|uniref:Prolyl endopeptidase n=1 Tax=Basidiobolus meristosporus CBS 931.73 TaxID=1314790 RepID=A0A1Y1XIG0_9FUNG|nr:peptidase S9A prolyl oligopeptidase domain protein beta-propeller [Basidiobolus meristosporus CBS 931.73]|eukprot:ORX85156.1 peptidase S9A prolyl oligopeptidase domain protein beta-propeller [Basidiobolus meristosporus CBS 931.73]